MPARWLRSPALTVVLAVLLAASLAAHFVRGRSPGVVAVVALEHLGAAAPSGASVPRDLAFAEVRVDFDAEMAAPDRLGEALPDGLVALEPAAPLRARFVAARRLVIETREPLPRFRTYRLRLGAALAALDGRPVDAEAGVPLAFETGALALDGDPSPYAEDDGAPRLDLAWNGAVAEGEVRQRVSLRDAGGRAVPFDLSGSGRRWTLALRELPADALRLVVAAGLPPAGGGNATAREESREVVWSRDLEVVDVEADADGGTPRVVLGMSHALADGDLSEHLSVSPAPSDLKVRADGRRLVLTGAFAPGQPVAVVARKGLPGRRGLRLPRDARRVVVVPAPSPSVRLLTRGEVLSTEAAPEVEFEAVAVPEVVVTLARLPAQNVVPHALGWADSSSMAARAFERRIASGEGPHARWTRKVDLAELAGGPLRGVWRVEVHDPRYPWVDAERVLQATDLAPVVRQSPDGLAVLASRLSDGAPVAGARVVAWTEANQSAVEGRTDAAGLFLARGFALPPRVVTVEAATDLAFVDLDSHAVAHAARDVEGAEPARGLEAWVAADRGAVRPGETARVDAVVRGPDGCAPPEGLPVRFVVRTTDGRVWRRFERRTPPSGFLDLDLPVPADAPTGAWSVDLEAASAGARLARATFRVEAFVPDRLEPELSLPEGDLAAGTRVPVEVRARDLAGSPAAGRVARLWASYAPVARAPVEGFVFGIAEEFPDAFRAEIGEATLDADGRARIEWALPDAAACGAVYAARLTLEVVDGGGRASLARATRDVVPAGPRLGLSRPRDAAADAEVVLVGADRTRATAVLERRSWRGSWVVRGGRTQWRGEVAYEALAERPVAVDGGRGRVAFPGAGDGAFRLRVVAPGAAPCAVVFSSWGGRVYDGAGPEGAPRLALRAAGRAVPGGTLALDADAPFAGRALVTLEGAGVLEARVVDLPVGTSRVEVPVPEGAPESVHACVVLARGARSAGAAPVRALGALAVRVERPERALAVAVEAPDAVLPEASLVARVTVSEPADLRVHLVDAGILRKTGHPDPDPRGFFGATRRLETRAADAYARLVQGARYSVEDPEPGGDGFEEVLGPRLDAAARITVETVALATKRLRVEGTQEVRFDLPPYEGRLRLVVVAASRGATGAAARDVRVEGPVRLVVHAPRVAAPGDEFEVVVEARGDGVSHEVALDGLERVGTGPRLLVRALDRAGDATVVVTARDRQGRAAVRRARVAVRPAAPYEVRHEVVALGAGPAQAGGDLPAGFDAPTRRARVTVGAGPLLPLLPAMERLLDYPYGCVEQTTSVAFPVLAASELARLANPEGGAPEDAVDAAVARLLSMQTAGGALAAWPGVREPYEFGTVYGGHFLVEAARAGREVPKDRLDALLDHLEKRLRKGEGDAYAAYVLTLAGRPTGAHLDLLAPEADGPEDRARLAAAYLIRGDRERAQALLKDPGDPWAVAREDGGSLASPVRAAAVLLSALADAAPDDPRGPLLAEGLVRAAGDAARRTTQEDAAALLALARWHRRARERLADAQGTLRVGTEAVEFAGPSGASLAAAPGAPWTWSVEGRGLGFAVLRLEGVPTTPVPEGSSGGCEVRRTIEAADGPLRQGRTYRVVLEGVAPAGVESLLVTDVLPGGLEPEAADADDGTLKPDRVEVRDDRVLFFRTAPLGAGRFRQAYTVRAVTVGRFRLPSAKVEALYDPTRWARAGGGTVEVVR